jgi:hypothetical protein
METEKIVNKLEGYATIPSVQLSLNINKKKAIYVIYRLRKKGYVKTMYQSNKKRVYNISLRNALGGTSYAEILNRYSPIKLSNFEQYFIYGREPSIEETLIYAVKKREVRYIIASLALFRKIKDWPMLYRLSKEEGLVREIAALYDIARLVLPKLQKMPKRFFNLARPKKKGRYTYIVELIKSDSFKDIEKKWKVYIPLNWSDLNEYKIR